jgi:IMP dehydrogenase
VWGGLGVMGVCSWVYACVENGFSCVCYLCNTHSPHPASLDRHYLIHPQKYRGMGSLEAMSKGSDTRYHSDTQVRAFPYSLHSDPTVTAPTRPLQNTTTHHPHPRTPPPHTHTQQSLKIAQGVSGIVKDKGSVRRTVPFLCQAVRQGFQDLGAKDMADVQQLLVGGKLRMETRSAAAQHEGGVHDLLAYEKKPW